MSCPVRPRAEKEAHVHPRPYTSLQQKEQQPKQFASVLHSALPCRFVLFLFLTRVCSLTRSDLTTLLYAFFWHCVSHSSWVFLFLSLSLSLLSLSPSPSLHSVPSLFPLSSLSLLLPLAFTLSHSPSLSLSYRALIPVLTSLSYSSSCTIVQNPEFEIAILVLSYPATMGNNLTKCCSDDDHHNETRNDNANDKNQSNNPYLEHPQPNHDPTFATTYDPRQLSKESGDIIPLAGRIPTSSSSGLPSSVAAQQHFPPPLSQTGITSPGNLPTYINETTSSKKKRLRPKNDTNNLTPSLFKQLSTSLTSLTGGRRRSSSNRSNATTAIPKSLTLAQGLETIGIVFSDEERKVLLSNEIPASEIEKLSIGVDAGGMGIIHVAEWKGIKVAIKEASPHVICKEVEIYSRMKGCEGIVLFYGVTYPPGLDKLCIVTKYAENGSLSWYLKAAFNKISWAHKLVLATQITRSVARLHQEGIYHRDLHGGNILIDEQGNAMLTDFGASTVMEERVVRSIDEYAIATLTTPQGGTRFFSQKFPDLPDSSTAGSSPTKSLEVPGKSSSSRTGNEPLVGVMAYIAPERFREPSYFDARCDVYSLGVLLWELTSGHSAFARSPQDVQLAISILNGKREEAVEGTPAEYQALYERCWDPSPEARPTLDEILTTLERVKGNLSEAQLAITCERNSLGNNPEFETSLSIPRPTSDYQKYFNSSSSEEF